jgi:hypothetical protein
MKCQIIEVGSDQLTRALDYSRHCFGLLLLQVALQGGDDWWDQDCYRERRHGCSGHHRAGLLSHLVRREWMHAHRVGKPIIPVVRHEAVLQGTPRWLEQTHIYILDSEYAD